MSSCAAMRRSIEIERILEADNLDTSQLSPRDVVEIVSGIERGRAPQDFWDAYQLHVQAWTRLADMVDLIQRQQAGSTFIEGIDELDRGGSRDRRHLRRGGADRPELRRASARRRGSTLAQSPEPAFSRPRRR